MKYRHLLALAALLPLLASARPDRVVPAAADVNVPVKPLQYQSVFADYTAVKQAPESPDKSWVRANCVVLGEEADAPASGKPPASGIPRDMASSDQVQGKHEHRGEHQ